MFTGFTSVVFTGFTTGIRIYLRRVSDPKLQTLGACHFKGQGSLCVLGGSWFLGGVVVGTHRTRRNTLKLHGIVVPKNILGPTHPSELWSFPNGSWGRGCARKDAGVKTSRVLGP